MDHASPRAEELAAALAGRLIHDVMGRLSGIMSGLDLLADPSARDMHADALNVAAASAMGLREEMAFCRVLYGASAAPMDARMLEEAARGLFQHAGVHGGGARSIQHAAEGHLLAQPHGAGGGHVQGVGMHVARGRVGQKVKAGHDAAQPAHDVMDQASGEGGGKLFGAGGSVIHWRGSVA